MILIILDASRKGEAAVVKVSTVSSCILRPLIGSRVRG